MNPNQSRSSAGMKVLWVIIIIIVLGGIWYFYRQNKETVTQVSPDQTLTTASDGKTVSAFPQDLLIEKNVKIQNSFALDSKNNQQPVVTYTSGLSLDQNITSFREYLSGNGWTITHEADPNAAPIFFYAEKGNAQVNINFAQNNGQVVVTIAYVTSTQ
jgi:hypothetical protein